jgi:hypothetical protein
LEFPPLSQAFREKISAGQNQIIGADKTMKKKDSPLKNQAIRNGSKQWDNLNF